MLQGPLRTSALSESVPPHACRMGSQPRRHSVPSGAVTGWPLFPASYSSCIDLGIVRMRLACPGRRAGNQRSRDHQTDEAN